MSTISKYFQKYIYPFYEDKIRGRNTFRFYKEYLYDQELSHDKISEIQFNKLNKLIHYCYDNVPYYRKCWDDIRFHPSDLKSVEDIQKLPLLTKQIIKDNFDDLISNEYRHKALFKSTGGSTGVPLKFGYSRESYERRISVMWRGYSWAGLTQGDKVLYLWGADIIPSGIISRYKNNFYNYLYNRKYLNTFKLSEANIDKYIDEINNYKPMVIVAYTTPLYIIAKYIIKHNLNIQQPKSIITGAEPLYEHQREIISSAFNCQVYNTYGSREVMLMASECSMHNGLHINEDHLLLEVVNNEQETNELCGDLLVTDLHNYAMPFIRYKNGDKVTFSNEKCTCGLPFKLIKSVDGRILDCIKTPSGKILPGEFFPHLLKDFTIIKEFQVIQKKIDELEIYINTGNISNQDEINKIKDIIRDNVGEDINIKLTLTDAINKTSSGKHRVTISLLEENN